MQNTVYECKRNGADFILLHSVTTVRFGNRAANVLVTEQPQQSVPFCIFSIWQNTEILLISNDLRFYFTFSLFLAEPITFHFPSNTFLMNRAKGTATSFSSSTKRLYETTLGKRWRSCLLTFSR